MNKNKLSSNKGFTLIEVLIAMSILSVVVILGNKVITTTTTKVSAQQDTFNDQQSANLINKYLSNDLEITKSFRGINIDDSGELETRTNKSSVYSYGYEFTTINEGGAEELITYTINVEDDIYSVDRKDNKVTVTIVDKMSHEENSMPPFYVVPKGNDVYEVILETSDNKYEFNVSSRLGSNNEDEDEDEDKDHDLSALGNIVLEKKDNSTDVIISKTNTTSGYTPEIAVKRYKDETVYLMLSDNVDMHLKKKSLQLNIGDETYNISGRKTIDIGDDRYVIHVGSNDLKIKRNNKDIVEIERDEDEVEVGLYEDTSNQVSIEIETEDDEDEVEIEIGDEDSQRAYSTRDDETELEVEIEGHHTNGVDKIQFKSINTNIIEINDNDVNTNDVTHNASEYYDEDDELEFEVETNKLKSGEAIIVNFSIGDDTGEPPVVEPELDDIDGVEIVHGAPTVINLIDTDENIIHQIATIGSSNNNSADEVQSLRVTFDGKLGTVYLNNQEIIQFECDDIPDDLEFRASHKEVYDEFKINNVHTYDKEANIDFENDVTEFELIDVKVNNGSKNNIRITWD